MAVVIVKYCSLVQDEHKRVHRGVNLLYSLRLKLLLETTS